MSIYRFVSLTPYQYDYVNFIFPKFKDIQYKWEHDYWATSYKELIQNIKNSYSKEEINNLKIANCVADDTLLYYLYRKLGKKFIYKNKNEKQANHVIIINRATLDILDKPNIKGLVNKNGTVYVDDIEKLVRTEGVKSTCNKQYPGEDVVVVSRNGVKLSSLRKLDNDENK
ncbi:hypothetical protein HIMB5_00009790 [alpha proteobacterium HIMB5]|nr:hypothetical protein HIMB5_00009790 [alpha proteobacterium HIMB5]